ncbi:PREDICTED: uncharacterized protein LOC109153513 [Ipomoea nil]|uniref:uncharacterized protein LOC109153513 n=1 Tax=Ipomoea nil TaxID=35883 RepID=UPI0009018463|nr:PREDICTED: uncharacterized protein LOC109153513 [Ipomoea nil]
MAITTETVIIQLNAPTHFPIKLTASNFSVWRRQVQSTLIGLDLIGYVDGTVTVPYQFSDDAHTVTNLAYTAWYRQDKIIVSTLLGCCSDTIQPIILSVATASDAWKCLTTSYANASRGRVISLKAKLAKNPKGNRSIVEYLNEMRVIANDLALDASEEYNSCFSTIRIRENPISFAELSDILTDHERLLRATDGQCQTMLAIANIPQKGGPSTTSKTNNSSRDQSGQFSRRSRGGFNGQNNRSSWNNSNNGRNALFCRFCNYPGHETRFFRKLARFLKDNNVCPSQAPTSTHFPASNATMASVPPQQPWLFDSGASHHATSTPSSLQTIADYGGPDEIHSGDDSPTFDGRGIPL